MNSWKDLPPTRDGGEPWISGRSVDTELRSMVAFLGDPKRVQLGGNKRTLEDQFRDILPLIDKLRSSNRFVEHARVHHVDVSNDEHFLSFLTNPSIRHPYDLDAIVVNELLRQTGDPNVMYHVGRMTADYIEDLKGLTGRLASEKEYFKGLHGPNKLLNNFLFFQELARTNFGLLLRQKYSYGVRKTEPDYTNGIIEAGFSVIKPTSNDFFSIETHSPCSIKNIVELANNHCGTNFVYLEEGNNILVDGKVIGLKVIAEPLMIESIPLVSNPRIGRRGMKLRDKETISGELIPVEGKHYLVAREGKPSAELCVTSLKHGDEIFLRRGLFCDWSSSISHFYWANPGRWKRFWGGVGAFGAKIFLKDDDEYISSMARIRSHERVMADAAEAALRLEQESRLLAEAEAARHKEIAEFHKRKAASRLHRRAMSRLAHSGKRQVTRSLECVNRITLVAVNSTLQSLVDGLKNIDVTGDTSLADQYTKEDPDIFPFFVDSNRRNDYVNEIDLVNLKNLYGFLTKRSMDLQFSDDDKEVMAADILEDTAATLEKICNDHSVYALSVGDAVGRLKVVSTPTDTVKVDKEDVEISDLVADACSTLGKVYQDQSFRMKIEGEYTLSLSRDSILEALYNVAENCIESNRSSGNKTIDVGVEGDKKGIYIKFGDYGIGLNDEQLKLLNSGIPLKTTKGEFGGGVGASDAYSVIVDLHGGNIIYKNRDEPKGVDTYIFLPYEQKEVILDW